MKISQHQSEASAIDGEGKDKPRHNNKNFGGKHMSLTKSTARRLSLLTGSSLAAALVSTGLAFTPTATVAQTVTCTSTTSPAINGSGTASVTLPAGTYNPGLTCNYTGDTATVITSGAIAVSATGGVSGDPMINGVNLRATGSDDINWTSIAGTVTGSSQTNGPVIDARTGAGNISISTVGVTGSSATVTHGIFAESAGAGNINISTSGNVSATNSTSGSAGIEARSAGGDVSITGSSISGRLYGIRAETTGSGDLTINLQGAGNSVGTSSIDSVGAAIYAKTGTGLLHIESTGQVGGIATPSFFRSSALRIETGGDATLNFFDLLGGPTNPIVHMTTSAGAETVMTHSGAWASYPAQFAENSNPTVLLMNAFGAGDITINSNGFVAGRVDMPTYTGALTWNLNARSYITGLNRFGSGDDTVTVGALGVWTAYTLDSFGNSGWGNLTALEAPIVMDFADGDDTFINNGRMLLGPKSSNEFGRSQFNDHIESETRFQGLDTFENAGTIYFGGSARVGQAVPAGAPADLIETDYWHDDLLLMPGAHFVGEEGSRLILDAFLTQNQSACDPGLRNTATYPGFVPGSGGVPVNALTGEMPASDCLGIQGGSTDGETNILINQLATGDRGGSVRIVLVDVAGGESAAGHFVLDPANVGYNPEQGGFLDLGYIIMPLVYDADAQQHVLLGTPGQNAWQTATWAGAAHDIWRTSTGSWFERQADLRGDLAEGVGGGIWLRTSADLSDREVFHATTAGTSSFTFDNSFEQRTYAITGGVDVMAGGGGDSAWVVGLMAGYANSEMTYDPSPNTVQFDSWNGGLYASFLSGGLYVDAVLNGNKADVKADVPALNLFPADTVLDGRLLTVGAQIEGGWRFPIAEMAFVEPLAGVSWVRTKWDDLPVPSDDPLRPGIGVEFDDPTSLRANIGARVGMDQDYGAVRAQYSVLGRVWNEFEGEHNLILHNTQEDIFVGDEFTGTMTEVGFGASVYGSVVSGFLNVGGKWADDYQSVGGAAGIRVAW